MLNHFEEALIARGADTRKPTFTCGIRNELPFTGLKGKVRGYLVNNTPPSLVPIHDGVRGEFSKVSEEYLELADAIQQQNRPLTFIEGCDLVDAVVRFQARQFWVPAPVVLALVYLRRLYKPIRNRVYDYVGLDKEFFNG